MKNRSLNLYYLLRLSLPLLSAALVIGCQREDPYSRLSVRLGWQVNANSAGQIAALENGFYKAEGLEVALLPGGLDSPSIATVASGKDQIGFANGPDLVINARASGAPLKIIAIIQQNSYHGFFVKATSNIHSPKDWEGKTVGVKYASPTFLIYQILIKKLNVDRSRIEEIPLKYSLQSFLEGDVEVYPGAFTNEAISVEMLGIPIRRIIPSDYGVETCGNVIFSSEIFLKTHPEAARKFVRATIKGWEWCLDPANHNRAVDMMQKHVEELNREKELRSLQENILLVKPPDSDIPQIGWINEAKLTKIVDYMSQFGLLKGQFNAKEVYSEKFLPDVMQ